MISVIIPVYNVEEYLERCIDSVIAQSYRDIEIILVDDGSVDSSGIICDKYKEKDNRIKVVHQKNSGMSGARNTGLEYACGEYVYFLDSDDIIHPECLKIHLETLLKNNADMTVAQFVRFRDESEINFQEINEDLSLTGLISNQIEEFNEEEVKVENKVKKTKKKKRKMDKFQS